jgi:hypothetical protein
MDRFDTQLVQAMSIVFSSPNFVLQGVIPIEVVIRDCLGNIVGVRFRLLSDDAALGQFGVLEEVRSGLSSRFGREESQAKKEVSGVGG